MPAVGADAYGLSEKEAIERLTAVLKKEGMADLIPNVRVVEPKEASEDGKFYWMATTMPAPPPLSKEAVDIQVNEGASSARG